MDSPWSDKNTLKTKDRVERLSKEILDFEKYISPTKKENLNRDTLLYSISQLVESLWPNNYTITTFGSSVTGLAFPSSDVDMNIDFDELPKKNKIDVLKIIRKQAINQNIFTYRDSILAANAKVPVLMATDENQVQIDISIDNKCFSSDRTATWIKEYPALKPLFMVLKQAISNFRVSSFPTFEPMSAKTAGLASYSLICLIVSYIQLNNDSSLKENSPDYHGKLLLGFLKFYSSFDNTKKAIDPSGSGQYLGKIDCPIPLENKVSRITIIDPDVPGVNVGRSTSKFDTVKIIFKHAFDELMKRINLSSKSESILSSILKVEHHYHYDPRRQGARFKAEQIWIENGAPMKKGFNRHLKGKRGGSGKPYDRDQPRTNDRYEDPYESKPRSRSYFGGYKSEPYSRRYEDSQDHNAKEYRRHKKNNNSHLAEHYRNKYDLSQYHRR